MLWATLRMRPLKSTAPAICDVREKEGLTFHFERQFVNSPLTNYMRHKVVNALNNGHQTMKQVLTLLKLQFDMLCPDAPEESFKFLHNAINYMHSYPGLIHHPVEDLIFERLTCHAPHMRSLCGKLSNEHTAFKVRELVMMEYLSGALVRGDEKQIQVKELGAEYCRDHAAHINSEEAEAFPKAIEFLRAEDWITIHRKCNFELDPLSDPQIVSRYRSLYDYLMVAGANLTYH